MPKYIKGVKEKGIVFFDVANVCYRIDSEQDSKIIDINAYSVAHGKAFRHDDKYLGDYGDDVSTYRAIFDIKNVSDRIIEKSIKDSLVDYKIDYSYFDK